MSIGAITGVNNYSFVPQIKKVEKNKDEVDEISSNKSKQTEENQKINEEQTAQATSGGGIDVTQLPYYSLMVALGLTPTGNKDNDYNETVKRLNTLIKYTTDEDTLEEYLSLADRVSSEFEMTSVDFESPENMTGATQISQLNQTMML